MSDSTHPHDEVQDSPNRDEPHGAPERGPQVGSLPAPAGAPAAARVKADICVNPEGSIMLTIRGVKPWGVIDVISALRCTCFTSTGVKPDFSASEWEV